MLKNLISIILLSVLLFSCGKDEGTDGVDSNLEEGITRETAVVFLKKAIPSGHLNFYKLNVEVDEKEHLFNLYSVNHYSKESWDENIGFSDFDFILDLRAGIKFSVTDPDCIKKLVENENGTFEFELVPNWKYNPDISNSDKDVLLRVPPDLYKPIKFKFFKDGEYEVFDHLGNELEFEKTSIRPEGMSEQEYMESIMQRSGQ